MSDLDDLKSASTTKIVGTDTNGQETNPVGASGNLELRNNDCVNTSAVDTILSLTTSAQEVKVGVSRLSERKYIWMQALSNDVKWGFDSNCRFNLFKNQLVCFPVGNVTVYIKMLSGTGTASVGEGA